VLVPAVVNCVVVGGAVMNCVVVVGAVVTGVVVVAAVVIGAVVVVATVVTGFVVVGAVVTGVVVVSAISNSINTICGLPASVVVACFLLFSLTAFSDDYINYNSLYSESTILNDFVVILSTEKVIVQRLSRKIWQNISLCGEIMKLGTLVGDPSRIIFRLGPNSETPPGGRHLEF